MKLAIGIIVLAVAAGGTALVKQRAEARAPKMRLMAGVTASGPLAGAPDFQPSPERPVGWRGDGSGCYPGANLPMEWGRRVRTQLEVIKAQANKPAEGAEKSLDAVGIFGELDQWLTLGMFPAGDMATAMDREIIPGEADLSPSAGETTGGKKWERGSHISNMEDPLPSFFRGDPEMKSDTFVVRYPFGLGSAGDEVAYAHTYVYAPSNMTVNGSLYQPFGSSKVWLNGKVVHNVVNVSNDPKQGKWGGSVPLDLKQGWNRLLLKASRIKGIPVGWTHANDFRFRFQIGRGIAPDKIEFATYETKNIKWMTKLPHMMEVQRNASSPIVVGDPSTDSTNSPQAGSGQGKLFCIAEPSDLICLDKNTGKVLWIRPNTFYDSFGEKDKAVLAAADLSYAKARGKVVTINSSRPLDAATATKPATYRIAGVQPEKAELGNDGRTIRFTAKTEFKPGYDVRITISGLKTADGFETSKEVSFKYTKERPVTDEPLKELLLSQMSKFKFTDQDNKRFLEAKDFGDEKSMTSPSPGPQWTPVNEEGGVFDFSKYRGSIYSGLDGGETERYAYSHVYVNSPNDQTVQLQCWRRGVGARVILNGTLVKVLSQGTPDQIEDHNRDVKQSSVNIELKKGWNSLLIGVNNSGIAWGHRMLIMGTDGKPTVGLTYMADNPQNVKATVDWDEVAPSSALTDSYASFTAIKPLADQRKAINDEVIQMVNAQVSPQGMAHDKAFSDLNEKLKVKRELDQKIIRAIATAAGRKFNARWQTWGNCNATPCSDGQRVYVWFHIGVAVAYDLAGNLLWANQLNEHGGTYYKHGDHSSPIVANGKFIVYQMHNSTAYDCKTGAIVWHHKTQAEQCWSTPIVTKVGGEDVFVIWCVSPVPNNRKIAIYRVADGTTMWEGRPQGVGEMHGTCGTPVIADNHLFNSEESGIFDFEMPDKAGAALKPLAYIKYHLINDVVVSPMYHDGILYSVGYWGELVAYDVEKRDLAYKANPAYYPRDGSRVVITASSPMVAGKYVYIFDNTGTTIVLEHGKTYKPLAKNEIMNFMQRDMMEQFVASPVADGNRLYMKGCEYMYCVGEK